MTLPRLLLAFLLLLQAAAAAAAGGGSADGSEKRSRFVVAAEGINREARPVVSSPDPDWRRVSVRLTGGLGELGGGDVNDGVALWSAVHESRLRRWVIGLRPSDGGEPGALRRGTEFGADLIVHLTRHMAIVGGIGRIGGSSDGAIEHAVVFGGRRGMTRNATALRVRSVPLRVGAQYATPVGRRVNLAVEGGAGLYFTRLSWLHELNANGPISRWVSETRGHDFGMHGGLWIDVGLSERHGLVLGVELLRAEVGGLHGYREGTFNYQSPTRTDGTLAVSGFSRLLVVGESSWLGATLRPDSAAEVGLSGLRFRVGLRVGL